MTMFLAFISWQPICHHGEGSFRSSYIFLSLRPHRWRSNTMVLWDHKSRGHPPTTPTENIYISMEASTTISLRRISNIYNINNTISLTRILQGFIDPTSNKQREGWIITPSPSARRSSSSSSCSSSSAAASGIFSIMYYAVKPPPFHIQSGELPSPRRISCNPQLMPTPAPSIPSTWKQHLLITHSSHSHT